MPITEHRLLSFDATPLFYRVVAPKGELKARLYIGHGMGEHGERYLYFAETLAALGIESVIPDWRGFGRSGGPRAFANSFSDFHEDLEALRSFIEKSRGQTKTFYLGHSFGGLLFASYLAFKKGVSASGLILSSPLFGIAAPVPAWRHALGTLAASFAPRYSQDTKVDLEKLTHDREILNAYARDPLIYHRISARLYRELLKLLKLRHAIARKMDCPILLLQSGEDYVVDKEKSLLFYEELRVPDKKLEVYRAMYHEILNELDRVSIYRVISDWLLSRVLS